MEMPVDLLPLKTPPVLGKVRSLRETDMRKSRFTFAAVCQRCPPQPFKSAGTAKNNLLTSKGA